MNTQTPPPIDVAKELIKRENLHDVDGAVALFADNAVCISSMDELVTREEIRRWQQELADGNIVLEPLEFRVEGNTVWWDETIAVDFFRNLGLEQLEGTCEITVHNGKIMTFTFSLSSDSVARLQQAMKER